jgi:SpoIID/LytB domain protein
MVGVLAAMVAMPLAGHAGPSGPASAGSARTEVYPVPPGGQFTLHGHGFGHGHGMSQWGAYGAAKVGKLTSTQILDFYYPHTTLAQTTSSTVRVLLTAADSVARGYVEVRPAPGLTLVAAGHRQRLPTTSGQGHPITAWRLQVMDGSLTLRERRANAWHTVGGIADTATFRAYGQVVPVVDPGGTVTYRGVIVAELRRGVVETVNRVPMERYLRSVVPAEMPASWPLASLKAQAVAARTYAARGVAHPKAGWYDVDGDTRDQAYGGVPRETAASDKAVASTAGRELVDSSGPVFAQFGAADGGWTVSGGTSYLPSQRDPYDGAVSNDAHAWRTHLSAASVESAYPAIGTLRDLEVTSRDGDGQWGGRILSLTLVGSTASEGVSGTGFEAALGLRSTWWRPTPPPAAPRHLHTSLHGGVLTVRWSAPASVSGAAAVTGYRIGVSPGGRHVTATADDRSVTISHVTGSPVRVTVRAESSSGHSPAAQATVSSGG